MLIDTILFFVIAVAIVIILILIFTLFPIGTWFSARMSGVKISLFNLVGMKFRRVNPRRIVPSMIKATKAGIKVSMNDLETLHLAGGNVDRVVDALIAAQSAQIPLEFEQSKAIDLAGRNVLEAVKMSVTPKVIVTPGGAASAKDGIVLRATARVTVRANIARLVGGAGEETIIARVGEGIVTTVGSSDSHKAVLENPDLVSLPVRPAALTACA